MFENQCSDHSHWEPRLVPMKAEKYGTMTPEWWGKIVKEYKLYNRVESHFVSTTIRHTVLRCLQSLSPAKWNLSVWFYQLL